MTQFPGPEGQQPEQQNPYGAPPPAPGYGPPPPVYGNAPSAGYGYAPGPVGGQPGGMGKRLLARIIDGVLLAVVIIALGVPLGVFSAMTNAAGQTGFDLGPRLGFQALAVLIGAGYEIGMIGARGATIGKQLMGLKVINIETGAVPGFGPAALRWLIPFIGSFFCGVGELLVYVSPFFDNSGRQQGWHDKVAKTQVVLR
ncbi:MAG TPA: RDD family protein [Angustibacter sp.]|nr:RDD family protein [Angustibacter sp.]